eukprot:6196148-Pleurochrysis_carterae.AAC.2
MGKLKRFLLRYYPPGIILEYEQDGKVGSSACAETFRMPDFALHAHLLSGDNGDACLISQMHNKPVDLLTLAADTDVEVLVNQIVRMEPLISENRKPQLRKLVYKLIEKQASVKWLLTVVH